MTQEREQMAECDPYEVFCRVTEDLRDISRELNPDRQRTVQKALDNLRFIERMRTLPSVQSYLNTKNRLQRYIGANDQPERKEHEILVLGVSEVLMLDCGKKPDEVILVAKIDRLMAKAIKYDRRGNWAVLELPEIILDERTLFNLYDQNEPANFPRDIFLRRLADLKPIEIVNHFTRAITPIEAGRLIKS